MVKKSEKENFKIIDLISIGVAIFITIGALLYNFLPSNIALVSYAIYFVSLITGLIISIIAFKQLNIETINKLEELPPTINKLIESWEFKDLIMTESDTDYWSNKKIKHITFFGVSFALTGGESKESTIERDKLLQFLKRDKTKITYICTPYIEEESIILTYIKQFLQKIKKFEEIKNKIEIYRLKNNPLHSRLILLEYFDETPKLVLYQLRTFHGSETFERKIDSLVIKISDQKAVDHLFQTIKGYENGGIREDLEKRRKEFGIH